MVTGIPGVMVPARVIDRALRIPKKIANRRRLSALEYSGEGYAVINDEAHDYGLLHYYIRRDDQEGQHDRATDPRGGHAPERPQGVHEKPGGGARRPGLSSGYAGRREHKGCPRLGRG